MKPCSHKVLHSSNLLQDVVLGNTVASIKGSVKKIGVKYQDALVVLYNTDGFLPISIRKPDANGDYVFFGLNTDLRCFVVGVDLHKEYNAVVQDNVVPK